VKRGDSSKIFKRESIDIPTVRSPKFTLRGFKSPRDVAAAALGKLELQVLNEVEHSVNKDRYISPGQAAHENRAQRMARGEALRYATGISSEKVTPKAERSKARFLSRLIASQGPACVHLEIGVLSVVLLFVDWIEGNSGMLNAPIGSSSVMPGRDFCLRPAP